MLAYPCWHRYITCVLRCLYLQASSNLFLDQLLYRKTLIQAVAVCHCTLYVGLPESFFDALYSKVASKRTLLTRELPSGAANTDGFRCPGGEVPVATRWSALPLNHALRWLHALDCPPVALLANLRAYVAADGVSHLLVWSHAVDRAAECEKRHAACAEKAKHDRENWGPIAEAAQAELTWWEQLTEAAVVAVAEGEETNEDAHVTDGDMRCSGQRPLSVSP